MRIGEIARRSGLRPSAIRFYEKAGLLPPALRQNGQRDFSPDTELCLATIALAREAGFSIAEIRTLFHGFGAGTSAETRWKRLARNKLRDLDLQFREDQHHEGVVARGHALQMLGPEGLWSHRPSRQASKEPLDKSTSESRSSQNHGLRNF